MTGSGRDIIVEITVHGGSQRVSAIDTESLVEVVFQAPLSADPVSIERLARQKLAWRLARRGDPPKPPDGRGGVLI